MTDPAAQATAPRVLVAYVTQKAMPNLAVGLPQGVWGWKKASDGYSGAQVGDFLILAGGSDPRQPPERWANQSLEFLHLARITEKYESQDLFWPDERSEGAVIYPNRVRFERLGAESRHIPLDPDAGVVGSDISEALRNSGCGTGAGYLVSLKGSLFDEFLHGAGPRESATQSPSDGPLRSAFGRVLALQHSWSSKNTPEMQERGLLIRTEIPHLLATRFPEGSSVAIDDLRFEGRDGTGKKTRVPWVRGYSVARSPSATGGWYVVYLFSFDGSAMFLSLNQGTTDFVDGDYKAKDASAIAARVEQARDALSKSLARRPGLESGFTLGDPSGNLAEGYQRGNVTATRYAVDAIPGDDELASDLQFFLELLGELYRDEPKEVMVQVGTPTPPPAPHSDPMGWLESATLWNRTELVELLASLNDDTPQIVLAGPPGTGKTWIALRLAEYLTGEIDAQAPQRIRTVQFHPSYGYEDFVEGLRPALGDSGTIGFERVDGVVLDLVNDMLADPGRRVLIVDELNRANLPRVFGELMFLLEYRDTPMDLMHSKQFALPRELLVIGTMNTADRSIRSVDVALRRRFDFFEVLPSVEILRRFYENPEHENAVGEELFAGFERLNSELAEALDHHHTIGQSFFMRKKLTPEGLRRVWYRQLAPLIEEYFFDQSDLAGAFSLQTYWPSVGDS